MAEQRPIDKARGLVMAQQQTFTSVLANPSIEFEREAAFAVQALQNNEYLLKVALNNPVALQNAVTNVAAIGISLNPASKLAYLVPRKNAICLDISYMGLMHIAQECGAIQWGQAVIVRANDHFELCGIDKAPIHKFNPFSKERGEIVGVYTVVKSDAGDYLTHTMMIDAVHKIRDRSEAWKAYVKDKSKTCPWVTDEEEMVKKTCVKQGSKYWPRRERLDNAVQHLNTDGGEGVVFDEKDVTPITSTQKAEITHLLQAAGKKLESLLSLCSKNYGRAINVLDDLLQEEAERAIGFLRGQVNGQQVSPRADTTNAAAAGD